MRLNLKVLTAAGVIAALALVFIIKAAKRAPVEPAIPEPVADAHAVPTPAGRALFAPRQAHSQTPQYAPAEQPLEVSATVTNLIAKWEEKVDEVLLDGTEPEEKARRLLAVFPRLPEEGQIEAAKHLSNLTSDEDYPQLGHYLTNAATSPEVLDELMADLLNRPDSVKLPTLLEIARNPQHAKAADAKEILTVFLGEDHGDNWKLWDEKLAIRLKDNSE